jgi:hypothetical protein
MAEDPVGIAGTGVSVQQVEGMVAGLDKTASAVAGALSPAAGLIEIAGSAARLPDPFKQIAKLAVGVGTGDVMAVISGAFGIAADVMEAIAATQYHAPADPAKVGGGYAPSAPRVPSPPAVSGDADGGLRRERQALETLLEDFDAIENAGGLWFRDGKFGGLDMSAVMSGDFPPDLKQAVRYFQERPEKLCSMDRSDGFDGLVTRGGLQQALCRVHAQLDAQRPALASEKPASRSLEGQALSKLCAAQLELARLVEGAPEPPDDPHQPPQLQRARERVQALHILFNRVSQNLRA